MGERADAYVAVLRSLLEIARPGNHYPDARRLDAQLSFLGPRGSHGVHRSVDLDPVSGLPTVRQLLVVRADRDLAPPYLREHGARSSAKVEYYRALVATEILPVSSVAVRLQKKERSEVYLEVVHDRLDAASGCLLRYTVHLKQKGTGHVSVKDGESALPTRRFLRLMERNAGADAELAFLLVSGLPGVSVAEVVRGQIGPLHFHGIPAPAILDRVLEQNRGAFILHLALERAGTDVAADLCRDPFTRLYRDSLGTDARPVVEARRSALGYRVSKERRLVCTPGVESKLRAALERERAHVVIRSA